MTPRSQASDANRLAQSNLAVRSPRVPPQFVQLTASDQYGLTARVWRSEQKTDRAILYLHGIQSHGGWYESSGALLAETGTTVLLPDRRGSGLNHAARGDTPGMQRWLDDVTEHVDWLMAQTGARRIEIVAVSWGGKLAMAWAQRHPERVSRVLLIAPGLFPRVTISLLRKARIGLSLLGEPTQRYPIPLNDARLFTTNPDARAFIDADPLKLTDATARFFYHSAKLDVEIARIGHHEFTPRVDLVLAGDDKIIRNDATRTWLTEISAGNFGIREFTAASHTLEFESCPTEFDDYLRNWGKSLSV